jgi:protein disulfide-isomerase A6
LGLEDSKSVQIIAINARRGWWRRYGNAEDFGIVAVESWVDAIRLGEGAKEKLPEGIVRDEAETQEKKAETDAEHDEL